MQFSHNCWEIVLRANYFFHKFLFLSNSVNDFAHKLGHVEILFSLMIFFMLVLYAIVYVSCLKNLLLINIITSMCLNV